MIMCLQAVKENGDNFLQGPVSGSKKATEDGQLIVLAATDKVILRDDVIVSKRQSFFSIVSRWLL